ncbi:MAG: double-strand break repair helicase AddA [Novosphingobium sp.]
MSKPAVHPLHGNQMEAVAPEETVWLSASAGTGKTQVLSSRVLRLLLQPRVEPSQILCLTFTRAGATEMAARINDKLAHWVRLDDVRLAEELKAIGADFGPDALARARTLFASVLDCPGGGLRIDTIHAFSQWLLGAFPQEANLVPGTRPMEDHERVLLLRQVLADLLVEAEQEPLGDPQLLAALAELSLRMGPDDVEAWLLRCAEAREAWFGPGGWQEPMRPNVMRLLGLPQDTDEDSLAGLCGEDVFDVALLRRCLEINQAWSAKTGQEAAATIADWLAGDPAHRVAMLDALQDVFLTRKGEPRSTKSLDKIDPAYPDHAARVIECIFAVREMRVLLALADRLVPALRLGRAFALAWDEAKQREGLIDFDDQIRRAAELLNTSALGDWIRYKLDRRFDHILVDEAQDTNAAQWRIIDALTGEFFSGIGQRGEIMRTLFVVGDYKQAIFRFQGTSPENFEAARRRVKAAMQGAMENAESLRSAFRPRPLREYGLGRSFRTAQTVLDFVDSAIARIGHESFGLSELPEKHVGEKRPGHVALWRPIGWIPDEGEEPDEGDEGAETWLSRPDRQLAERIAQQVKQWVDPKGPGFPLVKGGKRRATPGDVMVLVRKRRELAGLIVARLHAAGVPVAGVDRLRLGAPLAVRDLVAALRFAAQPLDDLSLASLLVSPLIGWSQEQLLEHGYREKGVHLWEHLRSRSHPDVSGAMEQLGALLGLADYEPPQALLHWLLTGPWQGRRKLVARLGNEANDPIDELLNAAHAYATSATPSLAGFLNWFDAGEGELKREAGNAGDLVRVMTVHGSKGLQAPIVVLADATGDPERSMGLRLDLPDPAAPETRSIPLPGLRKEERVGRIAEEHARVALAEEQEHWRLLYVGMTRAEEALFIGGALSMREKEPAANSWYARLRELFGADDWVEDPIWGARLEWSEPPAPVPPEKALPQLPLPEPLPRWLMQAAPAEPRPPRPLAPSALGEDETPDPPYPPGAGAEAARRGVLVHKLLERLPELAPEDREAAGRRWLARNAPNLDEASCNEMVQGALAVLANPDWAEIFMPGGLAEVPIAAPVGDSVVAGTIDRLLIAPDRIRLIDFKTSRRPPENLDQVPLAILRQMAAYAAALESTYPGREVEAALLYTTAPRLIVISQDILARHKEALLAAQ